MFKELLTSIHDVVQKLAHIVLIPVMAVLNGIITLLTHFRDELAKV